jgi:SPP1 family predicted phage head-tail adaptor
MKDRINLANPKRTPNGRGGWTIDRKAADRVNIWADFNRLNVTQQLRYNELDKAPDIQIIIRDNAFLQRDTFVEHDGKEYNIIQYGPYTRPGVQGYTEIRAREA